jgi:hypothetical protein
MDGNQQSAMVKRNVCFYGYGNERFDVSFEKEWNVLI